MLVKEENQVFDEVIDLLTINYGITGEIKPLQGEVDDNYYIRSNEGNEYSFKICSPATHEDFISFQNSILSHVTSSDELLLPKTVKSLSDRPYEQIEWKGEKRYIRLLTWVPGRLYAGVSPHSPNLLNKVGQACGSLTKSLAGFDHPAAHRQYKWDPAQADWVGEHIDQFSDNRQQQIIKYFFDLYKSKKELYEKLPKSVTQNDVNDYNLLVGGSKLSPKVAGIIDFGDAIFTYTINELAIALAYMMMGHEDPIQSACTMIKGYNQQWPLKEAEVEALYSLIATRLIISVTNSMLSKIEHPENEYLLISEKPAWELLKRLYNVPESIAYLRFKNAANLLTVDLADQLTNHSELTFHPIVDEFHKDNIHWIDLSVGSKQLGNSLNFLKTGGLQQRIDQFASEHKGLILGRYGEARPIYQGEEFRVKTDDGFQWRTVNLGLNIFVSEGTPVRAAWDGQVHSWFQQNGAAIVLYHTYKKVAFYTIYRNLSKSSLDQLVKGQSIKKGDIIGSVAEVNGNGSIPTQVTFQLACKLPVDPADIPIVVAPQDVKFWSEIIPDPTTFFGLKGPDNKILDKEVIKTKRSQVLGKSLSLSYQEPLHIVRGYKQYLYDVSGRAYLDMVNNVPHVGHEHPRVVEAGRQQMAVLNTNTRYLHEEVVAFAEELLDTLPPQLSVCHFVNSGSEANELALRMVRANTSQRDMIVLETGYHGNSNSCIDISSYKFDGKGGKGSPEHTHVVPVPDYYRGRYDENTPNRTERYISHIEDAVYEIREKGRNVGGFIAESILSCAGQVMLPDGYLPRAYDIIREAGGLCIADEVQVGLGRVGKSFWGFELQGVIPDIVTIGKPLGNGHPLAAVICTEQVAERFNNGMEYFNTFGGNPVSCAIGRAVLQVIKDEELQQNADKVGTKLIDELKRLQSKYPIIGDVRGVGLFSGFELVRGEKQPAAEEASYLSNRLRNKGILMSTDGPDYNVLKLKPPMCFNEEDLQFFIAQLEEVLKEDFLQ